MSHPRTGRVAGRCGVALQRLHGPADGEMVGELLGVDHGLPSKIMGFHGISMG